LHPVPFTWLSFTITLLLAALSIFWGPNLKGDLPWLALWIGGLCSAVVTFLGHLLNNYGIGVIGASRAAMIGASNPALTCVLAGLTIAEHLTPVQISGVLLVTLSVALLSQQLRGKS
jgi:drug/metabolite transporter (DMT)-like permease